MRVVFTQINKRAVSMRMIRKVCYFFAVPVRSQFGTVIFLAEKEEKRIVRFYLFPAVLPDSVLFAKQKLRWNSNFDVSTKKRR